VTLPSTDVPPPQAPPPDPAAEPDSVIVTLDTGDRVHVLDWGGPAAGGLPPLLLLHGLAQTAWTWAPVARRLAGLTRVLAVDLRGHGLSEAPPGGYDLESLAYDALTVLVANGFGPDAGGPPAILAGHGFGAQVAASTVRLQPAAAAGLALLDGGWEELESSTRMDAAEFLRGLAEPPEILRSMDAYLADRRDWDEASWDADQERAARATVDEKHAGRVAPAVRRHALAGVVRAMFDYRPEVMLADVRVPLLVLVAEAGGADDETARERRLALDDVLRLRAAVGRPPARVVRFGGVAHNVMRYRPDEVSAELLGLLVAAAVGAA
jgi:pimeloyl-ACP methyl ester carboxylesterase